MLRNAIELWLALLAAILITGLYALVVVLTRGIPPASDLFGHGLGILGFILMLITETLYSIRKRSRSARWGRMSRWLQFHIFTGLVGPYMVLLHTSYKSADDNDDGQQGRDTCQSIEFPGGMQQNHIRPNQTGKNMKLQPPRHAPPSRAA